MFGRVPFTVKSLARHVVYVPKHKPPDPKDFRILKDFLHKHDKILFLTGAGISTESGMHV